MKYKRGDLEDSVRVAKVLKQPSFIYATGNGFTISKSPPPFANQRYVRVDEQGNIFYHEPTFEVDLIGRL
jgi:hypothetical protein